MAFIDWLRRQHEESERNKRLFQGRPGTLRAGEVPTHEMVRASRAWGGGPGSGSGYQDRPGGQRLMVRQPKMPKIDNTLTVKDDGTRTHVKKWTDPGSAPRSDLRATGLRDSVAGSPLTPGPVESSGRWPIAGQSYPGASYGRELRGRLPHVPRMRGDIGATQSIGIPGPNPIPRGMPDISNQRAMYHALRRPHPQVAQSTMPSISNIGVPRAAQQATIPRQQMPPPRFVPRVDPSQFPTVQDRGLGTYDTGGPGVQMSGDFDWTGRALRENIGEDWDNIGKSYTNWWQNLVEEAKRKRQRGNY